jgi:hypothetical protein
MTPKAAFYELVSDSTTPICSGTQNPNGNYECSGICCCSGTITSTTTTIKPQPTTTIPFGLVGIWHFDEGTGTKAYDSSAFKNNGTLYNSPTWTTGKFGNALKFDGLDDFVNVSDSPSLDVSNITIAVWIYPYNWDGIEGGDYGRIVDKNNAYLFFLARDGGKNRLSFYYVNSSGVSNQSWSNTNSIQLNKWQHVAVTYDGQYTKFYVNGNLSGTQLMKSTGPIIKTKLGLYIGNNYNHDREFNGTIDEIKIWNRALTADEIRAEYGVQTTTIISTTTVTSLTSTITPTTTIGSTIACSGSSSHYCSTTYKSIDSVNSITVPSSASCGNTISVTVDWTGGHNYNDNHWGFFLESIPYSYLYYVGSCKSYVMDSGTNSYRMSCSITIPTTSGITNGNYNFWVTGEDYNGYCYPGEVGLDAQNYKTITLNNC